MSATTWSGGLQRTRRMVMDEIPDHDAMLDDPLYRSDVIREELATLLDELAADDPCADDSDEIGDY